MKVCPASMSKPATVMTVKELQARKAAVELEEEAALKAALPVVKTEPKEPDPEQAEDDKDGDDEASSEADKPGIQLPLISFML